jgi:hypothetical protein
MRLIPILLAAIISSPAYSAEVPGITAFTTPNGYIRRFPVNEATPADLLAALGPPVRQMEFEGQQLWSYEYGEPGSVGTWTFTIVDGVVTRVQYVNQRGRRASSD